MGVLILVCVLCLVSFLCHQIEKNKNRDLRDRYLSEMNEIFSEFFPRYRVGSTIRESVRYKIEACQLSYLQREEKQGNVRNIVLDQIYAASFSLIRYDSRFVSDIEELKNICLTCLDLMCQDGYIKECRRDECAADVLKSVELFTPRKQ